MTLLFFFLIATGYSVISDVPPLFDPNKEKIDHIRPIAEKPMLYNKEQFEEFKKKHKNDKVIDLTQSFVFQDHALHEYFPTGKICYI